MKCAEELCPLDVDDNGFTSRCLQSACPHNLAEFLSSVAEQRQALTLPLVEKIAKNEMPACFGTERSTLVCLASLLMEVMRQNEELARALQIQGSATLH